jgi:Peptidase S24-like
MRDSGLFAEVMDQALTSGTVVRFRAEGSSMHPTIRHGEVITVAPVAIADVVRGDVLLCRNGGRVLAHRVVAIADRGGDRRFELRGDGHTSSDAVVGADEIVARIVAVRRRGRSMAVAGAGGWLTRCARVAAAALTRTIARAIAACRSVGMRTVRRRS